MPEYDARIIICEIYRYYHLRCNYHSVTKKFDPSVVEISILNLDIILTAEFKSEVGFVLPRQDF